MAVLIACEESQIVTIAFISIGIEAYSCDIIPCNGGHPEWHIQDDVLNHLNDSWEMMLAFPPCTYLTNSGVRHLYEHVTSRNRVGTKVYGKARWIEMENQRNFLIS